MDEIEFAWLSLECNGRESGEKARSAAPELPTSPFTAGTVSKCQT